MRLYYEVARLSLRRQLAYSAANWAGMATNVFFGCLRSFAFVSLFVAQPEAAGYDLPDALRYTWLTQALLMFSYMWGWWDLAATIRSGQIATDLAKPYDLFWFWLSHDAGRAIYHLAFRGLPAYAAGMLLFGIDLPISPAIWGWFAVSLVGAELVSFSFRFLVNLSAFWLLDHRGVSIVAGIAASFFSGILVPISFFPEWLRVVSSWLPFECILYTPASVFLGKVAGAGLLQVLGQQFLWFVVLAGLSRALLGVATRRLVVQGG